MLRIFSSFSLPEAYLVKHRLEAAGIATIIQNEYLSSAIGEIPFTFDTCPQVWILDPADRERAEALLSEVVDDSPEEGDSGDLPDEEAEPGEPPEV